jgi:hypothetical protein
MNAQDPLLSWCPAAAITTANTILVAARETSHALVRFAMVFLIAMFFVIALLVRLTLDLIRAHDSPE